MKKIILVLLLCMLGGACSTVQNKNAKNEQGLLGKIPDDSIYQVNSKWIDQDSNLIELKSLRGKKVVASMVYMTCKYACPLTVAHMKEVAQKLTPNELANTRFVLFSFDPDRDTPRVMLEYAKKQKLSRDNWIFLTSKSESDIRELASLIDFKYKKTSDGEFEHSFGIVVIDDEGRLKASTIGTEMKDEDLLPFLKENP